LSRGWYNEPYRHGLAARGILSAFRHDYVDHGSYKLDEARRSGRFFRDRGVEDAEEITYDATPMIRELAGYQDDGSGRFNVLPKASREAVRQREKDLWNVFWEGYYS
jgi:hypothetical protein